MSRRTTTIVKRHVPEHVRTAGEPLDESIELVAEWSIELDDELRAVISSQLSHVTIESRGWDNTRKDSLRISAAQLHMLSDQLRELYELDDALHLDAPVEPTHESIEQPDASSGQTFTVVDEQLAKLREDGEIELH